VSSCKDCGEPIRWARVAGTGKWHQPLEPIGVVIVLDRNDHPTKTRAYLVHRCDEARVAARAEWQHEHQQEELTRRELEQKKRLSAAQSRVRRRENAQLGIFEPGERENRYQDAMKFTCPKCDASVGERCVDLTVLKLHHRREFIVDAHSARWVLALEG
jgi:hypothetical protein